MFEVYSFTRSFKINLFSDKGIESLPQYLYNPNIFRFQRRKPLTFQTMTSIRSNNKSLKYQRFTTLGFKDRGIRKSEFVATI